MDIFDQPETKTDIFDDGIWYTETDSPFFGKTRRANHDLNEYEIEVVRAGQPRPYADTTNVYIVRDGAGRSEADVRDYCTQHICRADDPVVNRFQMHLQEFRHRGNGEYYYRCGHTYTG